MSASSEQSYYEIALTNRQVLTVFVVLLVCVVAAFFSGVWIGRRGELETAKVEIAQEKKSPTTEEKSLKELHFFSEGQQQSTARPGEEIARSQDRGRRPVEEPIRKAATTEKPSAAEPGLVPPATGPSVAEQEAAPSPARVAEQPDSSGSSIERVPERTSAEEIAGDLVIQVFFSSDQQKAGSLVERLVGGGYPAFLSPVEVGDQIMYRVRLGPYQERAEAEVAADRVRRAFKLDTWITQ